MSDKRVPIFEGVELSVEEFRESAGLEPRFHGLRSEAADRKTLSKEKKKVAPHMWVISKDSGGGYIVTIGDPKKSSSTIKQRFSGPGAKQELKLWAKYEIGKTLSADHVVDISGMKLVPEYYSQWYVDNMM
jgi:hypothetical protein